MTPARVLIVDDEKNIRLTLTQTLVPMGLEVKTAITGEEAIECLLEQRFDLVLLDLRLPGMDGMAVLRWVREHQEQLPVALMSAHGDISTAVEAMKLGAVDFLQKPFSPSEVRQVVRNQLGTAEVGT
jgi:DNA-binding NtrC family response regulator